MKESGGALSRNPNICASCSSIVDGMDEMLTVPEVPERLEPAPTAHAPQIQKANQEEKLATERASVSSQVESV